MSKSRRNVLLITLDQWRGDCLSALGHPCVKTPNVDALFSDGMLFRNHYSVCVPCSPARASLLTGMYQQNHRVVRNGTPLDDRHDNLARALRTAGYQPTLFGYTDTSLDPRVHDLETVTRHGYENVLPGFDEGLLLTDGNPVPWMDHLKAQGYDFATREAAFTPSAEENNAGERGRSYAPARFKHQHSQTALVTDKTIEYVGTTKPGWCVHLSYLRPHPPFVAPEPWNAMVNANDVPLPVRATDFLTDAEVHPWMRTALGKHNDWFDPSTQEVLGTKQYDREMRQLCATYFGLVSKVDYYIGKLLDHLKSSGQYENTLIILTADHGELLGDHWLFGKRSYFDSAYHVPLIICDPAQPSSKRGYIEQAFTESVDVMPTVLDALDIDIPRQCDGYSLMPYLRGDKPSNARHDLHWEYDFRDQDNAELEKQLGIAIDKCQMNVIRDQHYKYVHFTNLPPLLFDVQNDPAELINLADDPTHATVLADMAQRMLSWRMRNDERTLTDVNVTREGVFKGSARVC